ncbi:MAG: ZIP family metal transporter [bacterium]
MVPFVGTALGSGLVFCAGQELKAWTRKALAGFAAGVMVAASVWSLILPAIEQSTALGVWRFVPSAGGFWLGILFLLFLDKTVPHMHLNAERAEGTRAALSKNAMLLLAVTIHNIPEGMAVGVVYAGYLTGQPGITALGAMSLALGIAIQNLPEGAIISLPLHGQGMGRGRAFVGGVLTGAVEPLGAALMLLAARWLAPAMPWFLSFAAGAMVYVVVEELIPETAEPPHSNAGTLLFAAGFTLMMGLDVALG